MIEYERFGVGNVVFGDSFDGIAMGDGPTIASADLRVRGLTRLNFPAPLRPSTSRGGKRRF